MALTYNTQAEVPEEMRTHFVEKDGAWHFDPNAGPLAAKIEEMRQHNIGLNKKLAAYGGMSPEEIAKLADDKRKLEEETALKAGEFEKVFEQRMTAKAKAWEKTLAEERAEKDSYRQKLAVVTIDNFIAAEATKLGAHASALPDISARARASVALIDGVPRVVEADGKTIVLGKDGVTPKTLPEWMGELPATAPHLFNGNAGGGAAGSGAGGAKKNGSAPNPFRRETWNVTEQMRLRKTDPDAAARLEAAAGK